MTKPPSESMLDRIISFYCFCNDFIKAIAYKDDTQSQMSTAEIMTTALVATEFYGGNFENARSMLRDHDYVKGMLSKSRFNRRLHSIPEVVWLQLSHALGTVHKALNRGQAYCVDSIPIPVCDNIRISRSNIYTGEDYRGYIASKRRYFYGLRIHLVVTTHGKPVEMLLAPGSDSDIQ